MSSTGICHGSPLLIMILTMERRRSARVRAFGGRTTRQRQLLLDALAGDSRFRTAQTIHDLLRQQGRGVGLATVYRTLRRLADEGHVDEVRAESGESLFGACRWPDHHHHLVCRGCGHAVVLRASAAERTIAGAASRHGFRDLAHRIDVFGLCRTCGRP